MRILLIALFLLAGCSGSNNQAVRYFHIETPRPFGYVIGDEIPQRIIIETRPDATLQTASMPAKGPINRWLNLNQVSVINTGQHYEIDLRYQVFYAPLEVKMLTIPGFKVLLTQGEQTYNQTVPDWSFNLSPLRELAVRKSDEGEYMRPDAAPSLLPNTLNVYGLYASLSLAFLIAAYLCFLYGYFPKLWRRNLFKQALRKIEALSKSDMDQALTTVHQALNSLYRQPLFHNQLSHFFQLNPQYQQMRSELDWFFTYSNRYFFTSGMVVVQLDLEKLKEFCKQCRKIERGSQ
jgi:mxaA protein